MYASFSGIVASSKVVGGFLVPTLWDVPADQQRAIGAFVDVTGKPFCTGSLVSPHVVLSAAHCGAEVGDVFATGPELARPEATAVVTEIRRAPGYNGSTRDQLLARLDRAIPGVRSFQVAATPPVAAEQLQGVGYGLIAPDATPNLLRWWVVEPVTLVSSFWFAVDGYGQRGLCNGDSGGPALRPGLGGFAEIVGTVSQGAVSCVGEDLYSLVDAGWVAETLAAWPTPGTSRRQVWTIVAATAATIVLAVGAVVVIRR